MEHNARCTARRAGAALLFAIAAAAAQAQDFPNRPLHIIVPWAPGGITDIIARVLAPKLSSRFGQPFIIESKPGASGNIGADYVAVGPGSADDVTAEVTAWREAGGTHFSVVTMGLGLDSIEGHIDYLASVADALSLS